jgi:hypothetical protein
MLDRLKCLSPALLALLLIAAPTEEQQPAVNPNVRFGGYSSPMPTSSCCKYPTGKWLAGEGVTGCLVGGV